MPDIKIIAALTVMILYVRWEFMSPFVNPKTGRKGTKLQIALPFLGFLASAVLVQVAVILDSNPASFILLALGSVSLLAAASYGILRRLGR
jgi:hypothetical protein